MSKPSVFSPPPAEKLFLAIETLNENAVKDYFDQGGSIAVKSSSGFTPLTALSLTLVAKEKEAANEHDDEEDEDDLITFSTAVEAPTEMDDSNAPELYKTVRSIGLTLLEQGDTILSRMGRTKTTQTIQQFIKARSPFIFKDWDAMEQKNKILVKVEPSLEEKPDIHKKRKI